MPTGPHAEGSATNAERVTTGVSKHDKVPVAPGTLDPSSAQRLGIGRRLFEIWHVKIKMELLGDFVRRPGRWLVVDSELESQPGSALPFQVYPVVFNIGDAPAEQCRIELGELLGVVGIEDNTAKPDIRTCLSCHVVHPCRTH